MSKYLRSNSLMQDPHQQLQDYTKSNNVREIKKLIENNKGLLSLEYDNGLTILETTCLDLAEYVKAGTVLVLLELGADPTKCFEDDGYKSALHFAAMGQNPDILDVIASHRKININATTEGRNALHLLINDAEPGPGMLKCVEVLWRKGLDLHATDEKGNTALYFAARKKLIDVVKFILSKDNCVTSKDADQLHKLDQSLSFVIDDSARTLSGMDYLNKKQEGAFISWISKSDDDEEQLEKSYLQFAVERHLLQAVDFLIVRDPNKVGKTNQTHPLLIALEKGDYQIVERFLKASNLELPSNAINEALKRIDWDGTDIADYQRTCKLILDMPNLDVNVRDTSNGNYPLHYAVKYAGKKVVGELLSKKASLANRDKFNNLAVKDIEYETLEAYFDSCIEAHPDDTKDQNREGLFLTFDYTSLLPTDTSEARSTMDYEKQMQKRQLVKENDVVLYLSKDRELKPLLQHPLIISFLYVKWHRVRFLFLANLIAYLLFCASLLWFILSNYNEPDQVPVDLQYLLLFVTTLVITIRELSQMVSMAGKYIRNTENYVEVALLIVVYILLLHPSTDADRRPFVAFAILLAAMELLYLLGSVPGMSTYIVMLRTVSYNFVKFLLFNAILILAFAFSFYTLFRTTPGSDGDKPTPPPKEPEEEKKKEEFFSNIYLAFFKTLVMLTGEFEAGDLDFDQFPIASHIIFILFVVLIAIILLNLLNGLAVSDTQEIKNEAKLVALVARAQYISYVESMVFDNILRVTLCGCFGTFFNNWSRWWLKRVCITPQLQEETYLKVYPNQEGRIEWNRNRPQKCTWLCGGDKIEEGTIKLAKNITTRRSAYADNEDYIAPVHYEKLLAKIEQLIDLKLAEKSFSE